MQNAHGLMGRGTDKNDEEMAGRRCKDDDRQAENRAADANQDLRQGARERMLRTRGGTVAEGEHNR